MIQALIGPLSNLAGTWLTGRTEAKAAENRVRVAKADGEAQVLLSASQSGQEWERLMAKNAANGYADEMYAIIFALPLVLAFCGDAGREIVTNGFIALDACPDWYKAMLGLILSAVFASRQAAKFMGKK